MTLKSEIEKERKNYLGLNELNTKKVYDTIINCYKKIIIEAPREVIDFSIDIVICNMNYYNKLGKLEELNKNWGDNNFYVDLRNSAYIGLEVQEDGNIENGNDTIEFKNISELNDIEKTAFSIKEIIDLCKKDDFSIRIYAKDDCNYETTLEISPHRRFEMCNSIETYLKTLI